MKTPIVNYEPGKVIQFHGEPCLVLEHRKDGTLLLVLEQITHTFGSSNNYAKSDLAAHLNSSFLDALTEGHPEEVILRTIDLTALNGSTEYGTCECRVAPLTLDELRKYHAILPKPESWEWSATPWSAPQVDEDESWVLGLSTSGYASNNYCANTNGARPAFLLPLTYAVEAEEPDTATALSGYSDKELIEELWRRIK